MFRRSLASLLANIVLPFTACAAPVTGSTYIPRDPAPQCSTMAPRARLACERAALGLTPDIVKIIRQRGKKEVVCDITSTGKQIICKKGD